MFPRDGQLPHGERRGTVASRFTDTMPLVHNHILAALQTHDCPDYHSLAGEECLEGYGEAFDALLLAAKRNLQRVEGVAVRHATYDTLQDFLTMDDTLDQLWAFINHLDKTSGTERTRAIIQQTLPRIVATRTDALLSRPIYRILQALMRRKGLSRSQRRSVELALRTARLAGAHLPAQKRRRLRELNQELSALEERFATNIIDSRKHFLSHITAAKQLGEMPASDRAAAKAEAKARGLRGWVFTLSQPSLSAIITYSPDRALRKLFAGAQSAIATTAPHDNRPLIIDILRLRKEKARLLGFTSFPAYVLSERMAQRPERVHSFLRQIATPARKKAQVELRGLARFAKLPELERWDVAYYSEKLQRERHGISEADVQEYFPLEHTMQQLFTLAEELFGITFVERDCRSYHAETRTYEVRRNDQRCGYLLLDLFTRPTKQAGAWCDALRGGWSKADGTRQHPVCICMMNFGKTHGRHAMLRHDEVETLFHEFGHALHLLLCESKEANLSAFQTEWDFVELPSQLLENWTWEAESLRRLTKHVRTRKRMPAAMVRAMRKKQRFLSGQRMLTQCTYSMMDQLLHESSIATVEQLDTLCLTHARRWSVLPTQESYRVHPSFGHIFSGGYASGYYSYLWAQVLEADVFSVFKRRGMFSARTGDAFRRCILAPGATKPANALLRSFLGRSPSVRTLLRSKGLLPTTSRR